MPDEEEIGIHIERASKRLESAHPLFKDCFFEDAVSRAYYSMFFAAKALLLKRNIVVKTHRGLISRFGQEFVDKGVIEKDYGRILRIAEETREDADYSSSCEISKEEAKLILEDADKFLERIKTALDDLK